MQILSSLPEFFLQFTYKLTTPVDSSHSTRQPLLSGDTLSATMCEAMTSDCTRLVDIEEGNGLDTDTGYESTVCSHPIFPWPDDNSSQSSNESSEVSEIMKYPKSFFDDPGINGAMTLFTDGPMMSMIVFMFFKEGLAGLNITPDNTTGVSFPGCGDLVPQSGDLLTGFAASLSAKSWYQHAHNSKTLFSWSMVLLYTGFSALTMANALCNIFEKINQGCNGSGDGYQEVDLITSTGALIANLTILISEQGLMVSEMLNKKENINRVKMCRDFFFSVIMVPSMIAPIPAMLKFVSPIYATGAYFFGNVLGQFPALGFSLYEMYVEYKAKWAGV